MCWSFFSNCQSQLPATGVPVVRPQTNRSKVLFEEYVRSRTLANWKFWIVSIFTSINENLMSFFHSAGFELLKLNIYWLLQTGF